MGNWLTTRPSGLSRLAFVLCVLAWSGCVGGQSGTEGLCPEGMIQRTEAPDGSMNDAFGTLGADDDGGVEMPPDADATLVATEDAPNQCVVPEQ